LVHILQDDFALMYIVLAFQCVKFCFMKELINVLLI